MTLDFFLFILAFAVLAAIALWLDPPRKAPRPKKKFLKRLLHSKPIIPGHQPPTGADGEYSSLARDDDRLFFGHFAEFAAVVNSWLGDEHVGSRWRLQERPDGDLSLARTFEDGPTLGRCYDIFYNQVRLGRLEIEPGVHYSAENPKLLTSIEIDWVRLLSFEAVVSFLAYIADHVCKDGGERMQASQSIHFALTKVLWKTQRFEEHNPDEDWGKLKLRLNGTASPWYCNRRAALLKQQSAA